MALGCVYDIYTKLKNAQNKEWTQPIFWNIEKYVWERTKAYIMIILSQNRQVEVLTR